ncbi:MAG: hypothetical protein JXB36_01040 [Gammaproteobacteria bacterium]|nr:hypothetical protein [Gammaproteobacteria bacterium]
MRHDGNRTAPADLPIRCACGTVTGVLRGATPQRGIHAVCYCDDCQSFAHFLGRPGDVLDEHGGTEVFQTSPARLEIETGADKIALMRLRPKGLFRWYTSCCRTAIGNTLPNGRMPFVGLIHSCIAAGPAERDAALGPVRARVMSRYAKGDISGLDADRKFPLTMIPRIARVLLSARLRGDHKRSPFFAPDGAPVAEPLVLDAQQLGAVEKARDEPRHDT